MPKSTPCRRGRGGDDGREEGSHGGYPNLTVRHDFASAKASPAASESLKPEIGRYAREMEEESSRIDVDSRKTKRGNRTHEPAYEAPRIAPCMPEAPEAGEMPTISTLLRSFWHRAETQSEIDQVAHLHAERVRDPSQLLEPDLDLPLLDAGDVGVELGWPIMPASVRCERPCAKRSSRIDFPSRSYLLSCVTPMCQGYALDYSS